MTAIHDQSEVAKALCKCLGLDPAKTAEITISIHPHEVIFADVRLYIQEDQMEKLIGELEHYELRKVKK